MSLISRSRLIIDSPRSPSVAVTTIARPNTRPFHQASWNVSVRNRTPATEHAITDPANPSHVFAFETIGASGWRPNSTPVAYPPVSLQTTVATKTITRAAPSDGWVRSTAKPARVGT